MQFLHILSALLAISASMGVSTAHANHGMTMAATQTIPLPQDIKCRDGNSCKGTNTTCCQLKSGGFGCCPYGPDASCCGDGTCCQLGFDCVKANGTSGCEAQSTFCNLCQMSVGLVINKGCTAACAALSGPLAWVCGFLMEYVGCNTLVEFITLGETPNKICHQVGLCGTVCPCGRCSKLTPDSCLGIPARCPKRNTKINEIDVEKPMPASQIRSTLDSIISVRKAQREMEQQTVISDKQGLDAPLICFNGKCDESHLDCCLTCF